MTTPAVNNFAYPELTANQYRVMQFAAHPHKGPLAAKKKYPEIVELKITRVGTNGLCTLAALVEGEEVASQTMEHKEAKNCLLGG